jgi:four helix bundle protein
VQNGKWEEGEMKSEERDLRPRTKLFARRIIRLYSSLPRETVAQVLGKQALRSGTSIGANHREACRARSKAEFISKTGDCLKEADETLYWLELLQEEKIVSQRRSSAWVDEADQLVASRVASLNTSRGN